jgi:RNA polymerase sigma factor (TIGR02999 family)
MSDVTQILNAIDAGDPKAADQLLPLVYDELRKLAAAKLAQEKPGQTLDATGLVHEAYVRLVANPAREGGGDLPPSLRSGFANSRHFFAAAAEAMRRILIERARQRSAVKYGGGRQRVPLSDVVQFTQTPDGLLAVDEALERFTAEEPQKAELDGRALVDFCQGLALCGIIRRRLRGSPRRFRIVWRMQSGSDSP